MPLKNHPLLPSDATPEEVEFLEFSVTNLYRSLERKEDMFLVAFVYELGYKKSMAAEVLGISPTAITFRLQDIKKRLSNGYAKNRLTK